MRYGSLFSGVGGLDLGLDRASMDCAFQVENDPYAARVLGKHWPDVPRWTDITSVDWGEVERKCGAVDLVAGGFPCQDVSLAGRGAGLSGSRSGLWSEFARCLRRLRPEYVLVENVPGLLGRGMGDVLGELSTLGYDAEWESVPAAAFGAPHLRWRVFIVGHAADGGRLGSGAHDGEHAEARQPQRQVPVPSGNPDEAGGGAGVLAHADGRGRYGPRTRGAGRHELEDRRGDVAHAQGERRDMGRSESNERREAVSGGVGGEVPNSDGAGRGEQRRPVPVFAEHSAPRRCGWWEAEPGIRRVVDGTAGRVDRLRGLGNAVVPQVGQWLGGLIIDHAGRGPA